ncbi:MAG: ChbG/HpnK family deacetylase [Magnetococcales bacterium]|nr:ChbG/HpnK family deacetylase [Magnetococcales bacterium]
MTHAHSSPLPDPRHPGHALIVNADDFGLSDGINRGILESHRNGIVTSATVLANGPAFEHAMESSRDCPGLGIGVHLNVLRGPPLLDAATLPHITRHGRFHLSWKTLPATFHPRALREIEREYRAQIERVLSHGIRITHLDGEKHHHQFPPLFRLVMRLLENYRIAAVRCAPEPLTLQYGLTKTFQVSMLNLLIWNNLRRLHGRPVRCADHQTGIAMTGHMNPISLKNTLRALPSGVNELCCHPGQVDAAHRRQTADFGSFYIDSTRESEQKALTAPSLRQMLHAMGTRLITYADLSPKE